MPIHSSKKWAAGFWLLLLSLPMLSSPIQAEELALPSWKALYYRLSLLFVSAEAEIYFTQRPAQSLGEELLHPPGQKLLEPGSQVYEIRSHSDNLGRISDMTLWYRPDLQVLQLTRFDSGKRHRRKIYRYTEDGFWSFRRSPGNDAEIPNEQKWSDASTTIVHKPADLKDKPVLEDSLLFHMVSVLPLRNKGDRYQYYSYINDAVFANELRVVGKQALEVDYVEKRASGDHWMEDQKEVLHIKLHSRALDAKNQEDFEIMGLKGDLSLYVEPKSRVLVQLSGDVDYVGRVDIVLHKVEF